MPVMTGRATMTDVRYPRFLMWQFFQSYLVYSLYQTLISPTTLPDAVYAFCKTLISPLTHSTTIPDALYDILLFQVSLHMFSVSLFLVFSPPPVRRLSPINFLLGLLKLIFVYGGKPLKLDYRRRVRVTSTLVIFLAFSGVSTSLAVVCISGSHDLAFGLRGFVAGLMYASHYRRWVLDFPIVRRAPLFHYKLGVRKAVIKAIKLSSKGYLLTLVLSIFTNYHKGQLATLDLITEQIIFYLACVVVYLCWELNRNLLQVIFTERLVFAPPNGSPVAQTNPSNILLAALEDTTSMQHVRYLAYYDLYMVSESNAIADTWRRAAFFEETGETYKKVIAACLKPLEQLTLDLSSNHLRSSTELSSNFNEPFYDFQIFAWCARIASSLTVCSKKEDCYGVASNAATISTLLSSLLAVETSIKENSPHYSKAYSLAGILRTSIYQIVSVFYHEMAASYKAGWLQKDWITSDKPLYGNGSHELLVQKLHMFLEFQAN